MTEYEAMYLLTETFDRIWSHIQFWSSVSFGYLILAHVAAHRLNLLLISILTILYIAFSIHMLDVMRLSSAYVIGYTETLRQLADTAGLNTPAARVAISEQRSVWAGGIAMLGTFIVTVVYLPYNYYRQRRADT
jgi:hypothetical protein